MGVQSRIDSFFSMDTSVGNHEAVFAHATTSEAPSYLIESDFLNTSGMNEALGHRATGQIMTIGWGLVDRELRALSPDLLYSSKTKGDEGSFLISGDISEEQVAEALTAARDEFENFLSEAGILHLAHARDDGSRNPGTGLVMSFSSINGADPNMSAAISEHLHRDIYRQKVAIEPVPTEDVAQIHYFTTNTYAEGVLSALRNPRWSSIRPDEPILNDEIIGPEVSHSPIGVQEIRLLRREALDKIAQNPSSAGKMLMRFDIQGLHALNSVAGMDVADGHIDDMHAHIKQIIKDADPDAEIFEFDSRTLDVLINADEAQALQIKRDTYKAVHESGIFADLGADIPRVPLTMAHAFIEGGTPTPLALERMESSLNLYKMHGVAYFDKSAEHIFAIPHDASMNAQIVDNIDQNGIGSVPFALSSAVLLDQTQMRDCLKLPFGLLSQRLYGYDMTQVIARQQRFKDVLESGLAEEDEVLARLDAPLADFDQWLAAYDTSDDEAFNMHGIAKRQIFPREEFMTMSLSKRWLPQMNNISSEHFENVMDLTMQAQACSRNIDDICKSSSSFAPDIDTYRELLLDDIRTHVARTEDPVTRKIQGAGQALRAIHFMRGLRGDDLSGSERDAAYEVVKDTYEHVGDRFEKLGQPYDHIGGVLHQLANSIGLPEDRAEPISVLQNALQQEVTRTRPLFSGDNLDKFDENMAALDQALSTFTGRNFAHTWSAPAFETAEAVA